MAVSKRFPTDHHGPLLPPPDFAGAIATLSGPALHEAIDAARRQLLVLQQDAWISLASDGELMRRFAGRIDPLAEARFAAANSPAAPKVRLPATPAGAPMTDTATLRGLLQAGARYIQLDGSGYAPLLRKGAQAGEELKRRIAADAAVLAPLELEDGIKIAVCLHDPGDLASRPFAENLDQGAAETLFHTLGANRYIFDCGTDARRDFGFLSLLPESAGAALGLFDAGAAALPDPEALVAEIDRAGRIIDTNRLAVIPRHSLAQAIEMAPAAAWDRQKHVLDYILDVATRAWGIDF